MSGANLFFVTIKRIAPATVSLSVFLLLQLTAVVRADWINLTGAETAPNIAEITVLDDRVRVNLEISIADLSVFEDLVPNEWLKADTSSRSPLADRMNRFSSSVLQIVTDKNVKLLAELKLVEPRIRTDRASPFAGMINPTTQQPVPGPPSDKRVIYAELDYPFSVKPESLSIVPPVDGAGFSTISIGFIAYHKSVPIIDFRYLSRSTNLRLDWQDPWYTKFDNPNLKRHHKSAQMTFLYIEPREVRHEMLIRLRDLQDWTNLGVGDGKTLTADNKEMVKQRARAFFAKRNPLTVDGVAVKPASTRAEFLNVSLTGVQVVEDQSPLEISTAIIGVILSYPTKQLPQHVSVKLELFDDRVQRIPATAIDPAGPFLSYVDRENSVHEWKNFLLKYENPSVTPVTGDNDRNFGVPLPSLILAICAFAAIFMAVRNGFTAWLPWFAAATAAALAAVFLVRVAVVELTNPFAGTPDKSVSAEVVLQVLKNLNHAFVEKDKTALREALGIVVTADTLDDVEAEIGRALAIKVAGGGIALVDTVNDLVLDEVAWLEGQSGFRTLAEWSAQLSAGHWGHSHRRTLRFRALMELVNTDGVWKLGGLTVVDAKQQG